MTTRLSVIPAVYLFLERDGEVLLIRRANTGYKDGEYQTPAGHVEAGETPREAMVREAKEEVGVEVALQDLEFVQVTYRMNEEKTGYRTDIFFRTTKWQGEPRNVEPEKCDDVRWCKKDALPENTVDLIRAVLANMQQGLYLSEVVE